MPFSAELIDSAVNRYRRERDRYVKLADRVAEICREEICEQNAIRAQVTYRVKSVKSFEGKLRRFSNRMDKNFSNVDEIFSAISDFSGVRIAAYRSEDCESIVNKLHEYFRGNGDNEIDIDKKDRNLQDRTNFYRATHAQVYLQDAELVGIYENVSDISCEVQICTMMAHVWNEIEHDIGYKPEGSGPSSDEKHLIEMLGHVVRQGDKTISLLLSEHTMRIDKNQENFKNSNDSRKFIDVFDFISGVRSIDEIALEDPTTYSGHLYDLISEMEINSISEIKSIINNEPIEYLANRLREFQLYINSKSENNLTLNQKGTDIILFSILEKYSEKVLSLRSKRVGRGRGRPNRLYVIAGYYNSWIQTKN